jgi:Tfp pilus assembly protein PilO
VLTIAAYLAGAEPLLNRRNQAADRSQQLAQEREQHLQLIAENRELKTKLAAVEQSRAMTAVNLQSARLINQRIAALTAIANEAGLDVQSVNTGNLIPGARFGQLPIHITSTGTYRTSAMFLHNVQRSFNDISVTGFELSDNPTDSGSAGFSVKLVWYVLPDSR